MLTRTGGRWPVQPGDHLLRDLDPGRRLAVQFHRRAESHEADYDTASWPRAAA